MNYKTTRSYSCSYCNELGHTINKCQSQEITKLDQQMRQIGLFDVILFMFSDTTNIDESITMLLFELNKLTNAEKKVLLLLNNIENSHLILGQELTFKLYDIYYLDKIQHYLNENLVQSNSTVVDEILQEIKGFPKHRFIECATNMCQLYINHEQLPNELHKIYNSLYPTEKKVLIEISTKTQTHTNTQTQINKKQECPICYDEIASSEQITTNCQHVYCRPCIDEFLYQETSKPRQQQQQHHKVYCPMCRTEITSLETQNQKTKNDLQEKYCSKKTNTIVEETQTQMIYTMVATMIGF